MKKLLFTLLICTTACAAVPRKRPVPPPPPQNLIESNTLCGLWQRIWIVPKDSAMVSVGTGEYKVINSDGTYFVFNIRPVPFKTDSTQMSMVTTVIHYGNYEITSDSTYVEYVTGSFMGSMKETSIIDLNYKWIDPDCLGIDCGARGYEKRLRELWLRMKLFDPEKQAGQSLPSAPVLPKIE